MGGNTLLHLACWGEDRAELCQFLVEHGLDPNAKNKSEANTPFILAAFNQKVKSLGYLGKVGGDINITNMLGWNALRAAAPFGSCGTIKVLLDLGADPNARVPSNL